MEIFYLNLPEERNARIQQIYTEMKPYKQLEYNDLVKRMGRLTAFKDFIKMSEFNCDYIFRTTSEQEQQNFINLFNTILREHQEEFHLEDYEINYPTELIKFFRFWQHQFHTNAHKSRNKALKLMANYINVPTDKSGEVFYMLNESSMISIFGEGYYKN